MTDADARTRSARDDAGNPANADRDPGFRSAMAVIALLLLLSVAGVVHSLLATFGA